MQSAARKLGEHYWLKGSPALDPALISQLQPGVNAIIVAKSRVAVSSFALALRCLFFPRLRPALDLHYDIMAIVPVTFALVVVLR